MRGDKPDRVSSLSRGAAIDHVGGVRVWHSANNGDGALPNHNAP